MSQSHRQRHNRGYQAGAIIGLIVLLLLLSPITKPFLIGGPMVTGHENLQCIACHKDERGTLRQQLQANVQHLLNNRTNPVSVGYRPVKNAECVHCHERPNDRHPVYRFLEPKYREVRENTGAHRCMACHREHNNQRISIAAGFCQHCHDELVLKDDPVDVSHEQLVKEKRWDSCLACHDFHGNHRMKVTDKIEKMISSTRLKNYFQRGDNPYPGKIIHKAKIHGYEKQ